MKAIRNLILVIVGSLSFIGCESPVSFNEPQPSNTNILTYFPNRIQGNYLSKEGNPYLIIQYQTIKRIYNFDAKIHKNMLDSIGKSFGDIPDDNESLDIIDMKEEGDSILVHYHYVDTLFNISKKNILKRYKGYYFLNYSDSSKWHVDKMYLHKGILSISSIAGDEINTLRQITETASDTTNYHFKPTKAQFRKFLKSEGFKNTEYYFRVEDYPWFSHIVCHFW